jgi:hypothetical protein
MRRPVRYVAPGIVLLFALAACSPENAEPTADPTRSASASPPASDAPSEPPPSSASPSGSGDPAGVGTPEKPQPLDPGTDLLGWRPVPGPVEDSVTRGGGWTLTVNEAGTRAQVAGPDAGSGITAGPRRRISDAFLDSEYAVVVLQDRQETRPSSATVVELGTGNQFTLDGSSDIPTVNGGTWALGAGRLLHATVSAGAYCVASVDLATQRSTLGWCAPERHGFNGARVTPAGDALLTFDDSRPACRTVVALQGTAIEPFPGVPDCSAWEGLLLGDGAVWSVIPQEKQVENAHLYAHDGPSWLDLGPGTSGTLAWCGDAAYFVRDPQRDGDPAALMRYGSATGLDVVYESPRGQSFLTAPRCGGDAITLTAFAEGGDVQVSADLR